MTCRSLLVFLDQSPSCAARVEVAIRLARNSDCRLVGLAPTGLVDLPLSPDAATSLAEFVGLAWDALHEQAEGAARSFREACRDGGVKSFEVVVDEFDKALSVVRHAHCNDATLVTQADPAAPGLWQAQDFVEQVVLHSARPTLILPHEGRFETVGANVLVAWDDSREAARALFDALPWLRRAARVELVSWNESDFDESHSLRTRLDALHRWLALHGVAAEIRSKTSDLGIAEAIRAQAAELHADLIVMGAYGHARWAERMLGGATRGLLTAMPVPVLMSH